MNFSAASSRSTGNIAFQDGSEQGRGQAIAQLERCAKSADYFPLRLRLIDAQRQRSASGSPLRGVTYSQDSHRGLVHRNCSSRALNASTTDLNSDLEKSAHSV